MELAGEYVIPYKDKEEWFKLFPVGDIHWGARGVDKDGLRRVVKEIQDDDHAFWIGLGDYIDAIHFTDPRFDPASVDPKLRVKDLRTVGQTSMAEIEDIFKPIANRCVGLLTGNHEAKYDLKYANDLNVTLSTQLGVKNLGYSCFRDLVFRRNGGKDSTRVRLFAHHGAGSSEKKLIDFMDHVEADIYMMGHIHKITRGVIQKTVLTGGARASQLRDITKVGLICPSYLRAYTAGKPNYVEKAGYMPTPLATGAHVLINPYSGYRKVVS